MSLSNNPSPDERDPLTNPKSPLIPLRDVDPTAILIPVPNIDRLTDVLQLTGITPNDSAIEYLWNACSRGKLLDIETFSEHLGALDLSLELRVSSQQEIEWSKFTYSETFSVLLSSKHREGSELTALKNRSDGHPALDGLTVSIYAARESDVVPEVIVSWDAETIARGQPAERLSLVRSFYSHFKDSELPEAAPVAVGQDQQSGVVALNLEPMLVRVSLNSATEQLPAKDQSGQPPSQSSKIIGITLKEPPIERLERLLLLTGALRLNGVWMTPLSRREILSHLFNTLKTPPARLDVDVLKMCESAAPSIVFTREEICDGASFPTTRSNRVTMVDQTCKVGKMILEVTRQADQQHCTVQCVWIKANDDFDQVDWAEVKRLARPYVV